jgi:hypothetical protein
METFADKRLAHFEIDKKIYPPSFPDISNVLSELEKLVHKYYLFIKNTDATIRLYYNKKWINIFETWNKNI